MYSRPSMFSTKILSAGASLPSGALTASDFFLFFRRTLSNGSTSTCENYAVHPAWSPRLHLAAWRSELSCFTCGNAFAVGWPSLPVSSTRNSSCGWADFEGNRVFVKAKMWTGLVINKQRAHVAPHQHHERGVTVDGDNLSSGQTPWNVQSKKYGLNQ